MQNVAVETRTLNPYVVSLNHKTTWKSSPHLRRLKRNKKSSTKQTKSQKSRNKSKKKKTIKKEENNQNVYVE